MYPASHDFPHSCDVAVQAFVVSRLFWYLFSGYTNILFIITFWIHVFLLYMYSESHSIFYTCVLAVQVFGVSRLFWYLCSASASIRVITTFLIFVFWLCKYCVSCLLIRVFWLFRYPQSHDFSHTCVQAVQLSGVSRICDSCVLAVSGISRRFWYLCPVCACKRNPTIFLTIVFWLFNYLESHDFLILVFSLWNYPLSHDVSHTYVLAVQASGISWNISYWCYVCAGIRSLITFLIFVFWLCRFPESHDFSYTSVLAGQIFEVSRLFSYVCSGCARIWNITTFLIDVF